MGGVQGFQSGALVGALLERTGEILAGGPDGLVLRQSLREFLSSQNPIDIAQVLGDLEDPAITLVFDHLAPEGRATVLSEADAREQALLLMHVGEDLRADLISDLVPDGAAKLVLARNGHRGGFRRRGGLFRGGGRPARQRRRRLGAALVRAGDEEQGQRDDREPR